MKPRFLGTSFDDISNYLKRLSQGLFLVRQDIDLTPVSVAAGAVAEQSFTVNRLSNNESVIVEFPGTLNVAILSSRVDTNGDLQVTFFNPTGGALVPTAGKYRITRIFP